MYDYKFRQNDLSFRKPPRRFGKILIWLVGAAFLGAALYAATRIDLPWGAGGPGAGSESDVIPLSLPPTSEGSQAPTSSEPPAQAPKQAPVSETMFAITGAAETAAATAEPSPGAPPSSADPPAPAGLSQPAEVAGIEVVQPPTQAAEEDWIEHAVEAGESLGKILRRYDLDDDILQRVVGSKDGKHASRVRPGDIVRIRVSEGNRPAEIHFVLDALQTLQFVDTGKGLTSTLVRKETERKATAVSGKIKHSLFAGAQRAGLPDAVTMRLASIFGWDIDFALDIRDGDRFTVIYEELWADGEPVGAGEVLAAEFVNQGRTHRALRFQDSSGKTGYYTPEGKPLKKTFFRTPVKFTRISSGFTQKRWHPVLKRSRPHRGVDYAAPTGTPVMATGDGTVVFRGWKRGYGNVVSLRHGQTYQTLYGHLSKFAKGLNTGDRVEQGDVIGYVGQTGLATGPHLHYEFHVNGVHRNPLTVKAPIADPLSTKEKRRFQRTVNPLLVRLVETAGNQLVADAR